MNPQRALVTGGAGFFSALISAMLFLGEGWSVVVVDKPAYRTPAIILTHLRQ